MNCFIKEIIVLSNNNEKRSVVLSPGLNIITGDSKTGKSALIEIVDYCLCSRLSNIPQGIISEFGSIFCIALKFPSKYLVIGRRSYWQQGATKMYFRVETNNFQLDTITLEYFKEQTPLQLKQAQLEIERHMGLSVSNMSDGEEGEISESRKASLRDMASFLFQHQNLIANKHSLFYRFDDYRKRQSVIDSFPIFSGWANDNYFLLKRQREAKEKEIKSLTSKITSNAKFIASLENELKGYIKNYYSLIEKPFDENRPIQAYLSIRNDKPYYSENTYLGGAIDTRYSNLNALLEENKVTITAISKKIKLLEDSESYAIGFQVNLSDIQNRYIENTNESNYECPTCGVVHPELSQEIELLMASNERVQSELSHLSTYAFSYSKEIDELTKKREDLRRENTLLANQIADIENTYELIKSKKNVSNTILYAKAQIDVRLDIFNENSKDMRDEFSQRVEELRNEIDFIDSQLGQYNINRFFNIAGSEISYDINRIGNELDFEEQLKPVNLWFDLKTFSLTHEYKNVGLISLSEMGSGANWLTCHLSLFLGLLKWFTADKSIVPSILFLDQPSQVYFPKEFDSTRDEDIRQVSLIFSTILEEIDLINKSSGYKPQFIISDHADNLDLGAYNFNEYVRKRWTPNNDGALI